MKKIISLIMLSCVLCFLLPSSTVAGKALTPRPLLTRTIYAIDQHYVDDHRIEPKKMLKAALLEVELIIPEILVKYKNDKATVTTGVAKKRFSLAKLSTLGDLQLTLSTILDFIATHYNGKTKFKDIEYAVINGLLDALDPHSTFLPPKIFNEFKVGTKGSFGGLGIVIGIREGKLTVISPIEGTPAAQAGVKAKDNITQIDGVSTINMSLTDAVNRLRGKIGSAVSISIERAGSNKPLLVKITRALIKIDSVQYATLNSKDKKLGYLKIKNFQSNTDRDVTAALKAMQKNGSLDGLVLDLRNNPGGLLDQSAKVANHFVSQGAIVSTVAAKGKLIDQNNARSLGTEPYYPLVILLNEGSASASEIVAGSLQHLDRALVIGNRSFGKGSVQTIFELGEDAALKLTIAQYLAAGKVAIQLNGVVPDLEINPAYIDKEKMNLIKDEYATETDLDQHLDQQSKLKKSSEFQLQFYKESREDDELEISKKQYSKTPQIKDDFAVQLAKRIILASPSSKLQDMRAILPALLQTVGKEENTKIAKLLAELKINWEKSTQSKPAKLKTSYHFQANGKKLSHLNAGSEAQMHLTITNTGKTTANQLIAVSKSEIAFLNNHEFLFGKLLPGESKSWIANLAPPEGIPSQNSEMEFEFYQDNKKLKKELKAFVPVKGLPLPQFSFSYQIKNGSAANKKMPVNKNLTLSLTVKNIGKGNSSEETIAILSNESGENIFLEKGRNLLGTMLVNEKKPANFEFRISPKFDEEIIKLDLAVIDVKRRSSISQTININVANSSIKPLPKLTYQAPQIKLSSTQMIPNTSAKTWLLKGKLIDDSKIHDYVIFVDNKKIFYAPNPTNSSSIPFSVNIPLEDGNNTVTIAARDELDLLNRKTIVIRRTSKNEPATIVELDQVKNKD